MELGMPKRHTILCHTKVSMRAAVMVAKALASAHLVMRAAMRSSPHWANGQGLIMAVNGFAGSCGMAVINDADEWGLCAGLVQEFYVDVATYALLQG
ncbi:hypothetical protein L3X38_001500 [Prunus dulcis]|uniref:Uncharacterized protein n=1 Tax=Prunus dulcis TaxID=3755 RepID=A0AAD4WSN6_PRUDU|nr:hypothetical protein L3X38_001500 [Prunus dulcis]